MSQNSSSNTPIEEIPKIVGKLHSAFQSGTTQSIEWRKTQLKQLWKLIDDHEEELREALFLDIGKRKLDAQVIELSTTKNDIFDTLKNLDDWLKPETVSVPEPLENWSPTIHKQPKGTVLVIGPWNYPAVLTLGPLVGVIASGNTVILKPSEIAPRTAEKIAELVPRYLDPDYFRVINGGKEVVEELLEHPFGHIIYTGGGTVGKIVMRAAAKHLTPVTLELGGKSPTIVSNKANLELAAKRIAWGKFVNAGQTCVAPDYILVQEEVLPAFLNHLAKLVNETYGKDAESSGNLGQIINAAHWKRITSLLSSTKGKVIIGGGSKEESLHIDPTIITEISLDDPILQSEIFGPLLPVLPYKTLLDATRIISTIGPTPLALYIMSDEQKEIDYVVANTRSGGASINDVMAQLAITSLPFGGVGQSGMGAWRGKAGIETFSHRKLVVSVPPTAAFESLLEWRYLGGDLEAKFRFFKENLEAKLDV